MRHTITLSGNSQIKSQRIHCKKIANFQQDSIVKIQQNNNQVYAIYTPVSTSQKSEISIKYLSLNKIEQNLALITKVQTPPKIKSIQIQLSRIDYQLANNNFGLLQTIFLDQVNIVWPGAHIPLYYNQSNCITLMPKVQGIYLVDPYAAISFSMINQNSNQKINQNSQQQQVEKEQLQDKVLLLRRISDQNKTQFGYDNKIYIKNEQFEYLKKFRTNKQSLRMFCTIEPIIQFTQNPTLEQYLSYKKLQQSQKTPQLKPILVELLPSNINLFKQWQGISPSTIHKINNQNQSHQIYFQCTQNCKAILSLPQKLIINDQLLNSFQFTQTLSLQMFLKEIQSNKYLITISITQNKQFTKQYQNLLISSFAQKFVQNILTFKQFAFLQNYYPFFIGQSIYGLILSKKSLKSNIFQPLKNFLLIKDSSDSKKVIRINQNSDEKIQKIIKILKKNIKIKYKIQNQQQQRWLPIIKKIHERQSNYIKQNQNIFKSLFKECYQQQLKQSIGFLKQSITNRQNVSKLLFSTYSSNGKTFLHQYFSQFKYSSLQTANQIIYRSWYLDCKTLVHQNNRFQQIKDYLHTFISLCPYKLIFFDNIDQLIPLIQQGDQMRQKQKIISSVFTLFIDKTLQQNHKIGIFTAKSQALINPNFKFQKIVKLKNPNRQHRLQIISKLNISNLKSEWIQEFVDKTQSFSLGSLYHYLSNQQIPIKKQSKRKNDFSKIVGLQQAKRVIRSVIQKPNKYGFIYDKVKIKVPRGILLYGATGNGKTALGSAVEDQFPMKFFTVKGSDILSKYIGGSQAAVRQVFEKALSVSPSIIFFDEFQSIVPRRNSSGTGVTDRVVNQFLCYLDGVSSTTGVFIIAASSRPDLIDPALLRPGRIDSHVYLDYPDQIQRAQLLKMFNNSVKLQTSEQQFIQSTKNYSYSDLIGLLKQLRIKKSSEVLKQNQNPQIQDFKNISKQLFQTTVKNYRIGTQINQQIKQKQLYQRFKLGKGPQIKKQKFIQM